MPDHGSWEVVHVMHSQASDDTNAIVSQTGDAVSGEVAETQAIHLTGFGVLSIPAVPDAGVGGPEALALKSEDGDVIVGGRDVRSSKIAGLLKPGETAVYADGSEAVALFKNDGSINLLTTHDNTKSGKNVYLSVEPARDGSDGGYGGFRQEGPWGYLRNDPTGLSYFHAATGMSLDFTAASLPGPLASFGGSASITAPLIRFNASAISLGTDDGVPDAPAKSIPLQAALDAMSAVLTVLEAPASFGTPTGLTTTASPQLIAAIEAAKTAIAACHEAMPSTSVTVT